MGTVFVATDERFGSTVAIKETLFTDENLLKAFEREARLLNSLRHSALPRVSDHFIEENGQFIVMEYITGEDLSEKMERSNKAFSLEDVLNWANQLLDALDYLHSQEVPVIHRDIKPQNLKLTPRGQVILLDFGLAKGSPTDALHKTAAKSIFGYSRSYASLEQMQGTGTEARSDLYSLGATLYHLLTGIPPVDALTRAMNVLNGQPDPLIPANIVHSQVPKGIAGVLQKAMALNANERPKSADEMRQILAASDKEIAAEDSETFVNPLKADLLTQQTKIMAATAGDAAKAQTVNQPDYATEVVTESSSGESALKTNVVSSVEATAPIAETEKPETVQRHGLAVAAALGILLLVGSAVSAVYFYQSNNGAEPASAANTNGGRTNPYTSVVNTKAENANGNTADLALTNTEPANETTTVPASPNGEVKTKPEIAAKTNDPVKKPIMPKTQVGEFTIVDEDDPEAGNISVKGNTIETDDMIIDSNRIIIKKNGKPGNFPGVYPLPPLKKFEGLTPEQRQQLREVLQKQRQLQKQQVKEAIEQQKELQKNRRNFPQPPQTPPDN